MICRIGSHRKAGSPSNSVSNALGLAVRLRAAFFGRVVKELALSQNPNPEDGTLSLASPFDSTGIISLVSTLDCAINESNSTKKREVR